jgi:hypothetical protein
VSYITSEVDDDENDAKQKYPNCWPIKVKDKRAFIVGQRPLPTLSFMSNFASKQFDC